jgi:DNA-binding beta-propeller fold protein YncE
VTHLRIPLYILNSVLLNMNRLVLASIAALFLLPFGLISSSFAQEPNTIGYEFVSEWGSSGSGFGSFSQPFDIAIDSTGSVYVVDFTALANQVQKFTSDGTFLLAWGFLGTGGGGFANPIALAIQDSNNTVYVTDWGNADQAVQKFTSDGTFLDSWGSTGLGEGEFINPAGIAVDSQGFIYVGDFGENNNIQKFDSEGNFILNWPKRWPIHQSCRYSH